MTNKGDLRVYRIVNPPAEATEYHVDAVEDAVKLVNQLAQRDLTDPNVHANVLGLQEFDGAEWVEWYAEDGSSFDDRFED